MSDKKPTKDPAPKVSTQPARRRSFDKVPTGKGFEPWLAEMCRRRGFVKWLAAYIRISRRELAYLARKGIPGVERAINGYNFNWGGDPKQLAAWIRDRKRYRKGNRKQRAKRKQKLTGLQKLANAIHRVNNLAWSDAIGSELKRASNAQLRELEMLLLNTLGFYHRRIQLKV